MFSIGLAAVVVQQSSINISTELLISILINVAVIALAFGRIQANIGHLKDTADRVEKAINADVRRIEKRVEGVASRYHHIANLMLSSKLLKQLEDSDDQNGA